MSEIKYELSILFKNRFLLPSTNHWGEVLQAILAFDEMKVLVLEFPNISFRETVTEDQH